MVFSTAYPRIRVSTLQYTKKFTWGGVVFSTAYPRIHFTTYYLEVYLGRGGTFDCVSAYPAFSEVQLQNGRVFCSYSRTLVHQLKWGIALCTTVNTSKPKEKIRSFIFCYFASLRMILKSRCLSQDCPSLRREFLKYSNCCLCVKASISICKRLKWIYLEGTKRQLVFSLSFWQWNQTIGVDFKGNHQWSGENGPNGRLKDKSHNFKGERNFIPF